MRLSKGPRHDDDRSMMDRFWGRNPDGLPDREDERFWDDVVVEMEAMEYGSFTDVDSDQAEYVMMLTDLHRMTRGMIEVKPGMYASPLLDYERAGIRHRENYDRFDDSPLDVREEIQIALMAGDDGTDRFMVGDYLREEPFDELEQETASSFLDRAAPDYETWYGAVCDNLEEMGYDEPDRMMRRLAGIAYRLRNDDVDSDDRYIEKSARERAGDSLRFWD